MKRCLLINMLMIVTVFMVFVSPSQAKGQYSLNLKAEQSISSVEMISDSEAIIVSAPTIIEKVSSKSLMPSNQFTLDLSGFHLPFKHIHHAIHRSVASGFILVVQSHSNYLS